MSRKSLRHRMVNAFILFHVVAIGTWVIPSYAPWNFRIQHVFSPYMSWAGLTQRWSLFAPAPLDFNGYMDALITYRDGSVRDWTFPRVERMPLARRYTQFFWMTYEHNLRSLGDLAFRQAAIDYVKRVNTLNPQNPPVQIELIWHWTPVTYPPQPAAEQQTRFYPVQKIPFAQHHAPEGKS